MNNYAFVDERPWLNELFSELSERENEHWVHVKSKEEFVPDHLNELAFQKLFTPHWSYIIPCSIWENFECFVFHMTDLPFSRGGSPLQNLLARGFKKMKISALSMNMVEAFTLIRHSQ